MTPQEFNQLRLGERVSLANLNIKGTVTRKRGDEVEISFDNQMRSWAKPSQHDQLIILVPKENRQNAQSETSTTPVRGDGECETP